jgi:regulator of microtubule dynamics protein 3
LNLFMPSAFRRASNALQTTVAALLIATPLLGQDAAAVILAAERDRAALNATSALGRYEAAIATAPSAYELLWRAARESVDLGEAATDAAKRTDYFRKAEGYARRAVAANASGADGHFLLAVALGRTALSLGARDRVKYAAEIRNEALAAVKIEPTHAGALHVLGVWNAEIMRLSSFTRFAARNFLGGKVFDQASWAEATRFMEEAVAADPGRITHRLDLAKIYFDTNQKPKARATCEAAIRMPNAEFNDTRYKQECERLVASVK